MKIGIFTDAYAPKINGISVVALITKQQLEELGHEVFIFAPGVGLRRMEEAESGVFRFPSLSGDRILFEDARISLYYPPRTLKKIRELNLDVIHVLTPNIIGLLGVYCAKKHRTPLVQQYCTDIVEYAYRYPNTLPSVMLMTILGVPILGGVDRKRLLSIARGFTPRIRPADWARRMALELAPYIYEHSDHIVAVSRKVDQSLREMGITKPIHVVPTGVDPIPVEKTDTARLRTVYGLNRSSKVILSVGRLSREKNLDLLIEMFEIVAQNDPDAVLLFVGDYDYRAELEAQASLSKFADRIGFVGKIPNDELGPVYGLADVFAFPSITDTQGLVIHEAVQAGLPVVMIDETVTEVVKGGVNGIIAQNSPQSFADAVLEIISNPELQKQYSKNGIKRIKNYSAREQTEKLLTVFERAVEEFNRV